MSKAFYWTRYRNWARNSREKENTKTNSSFSFYMLYLHFLNWKKKASLQFDQTAKYINRQTLLAWVK